MNEIGQYIAGAFAGAFALGMLVWRITQYWKRARLASGNQIRVFVVVLSMFLGLVIAFLYPVKGEAPNGELVLRQLLSIALYGLINGVMISLAALGIRNLSKPTGGQS